MNESKEIKFKLHDALQKILNDKELALVLDPTGSIVTPWTIRKWRLEGGMPFFQVGRRIFYRYDSVINWLDKKETNVQEEPVQYSQIRPIR